MVGQNLTSICLTFGLRVPEEMSYKKVKIEINKHRWSHEGNGWRHGFFLYPNGIGRRRRVSHNAVTWNRAAASLSRRRLLESHSSLPDLPGRHLDSPHSATWSDLRPRPLQDNCFCLAWFSCYCIFPSCLLSCRCVHGCFLASLPWSEIPAWHLQANIQFITHQLVVMQATAEAEAGVVIAKSPI
jgi:hypothetical protein